MTGKRAVTPPIEPRDTNLQITSLAITGNVMDRPQPASANLMGRSRLQPVHRHALADIRPQDTHDRLVADILTRYLELMKLATIQAEGERTNEKPEAIAVAGISMRMEFDGLVSSISPEAL